MKKYYISLVVVLGLALAVGVSASVTSGTLLTGLSSGPQVVVVIPPTANPPAGVYASRQDVVLSADGASSIHYTFDGTAPSCDSQTYYQGVPIPVGESLTIKALSCYADNNYSDIVFLAYIINIPATPPGGGGGGGGTPTPIVGDINNNGKVDIIDFALMMADWGKTGVNYSDLNGDQKIDIIDFAILMAHWSV